MVEAILSALSPVVVTLLLGFVAAWRHDFGTKDATVLNRMVLLYAVPIALFVGTVGTPRSDLVQDIAFAIAIGVAIIGVYGLAFLLFRFVFSFSLSESVLAALTASAPAAPMSSRISKTAAAEGCLSQRQHPRNSIAGPRNDARYVHQDYE